MFGSLPFPNSSGDQIVSKAVTVAITALFRKTEQLLANVRAEPVAKLLQGSVDGFDFTGKGLLMYNGLRIEAMELYVQAVAIDFGAIFTGKIKLRQSTQATMRIVLSEEDLTTSFNTPFIVEKLQRLTYNGESLHFQKTQMILNQDKSIRIYSEVRLGKSPTPITLDLTTNLTIEDRRKLQFVDVIYSGDAEGVELGKALISHVNNLLDLDKFSLDGTRLRVDRLRIKGKEIVFYGTADIDKFPDGKRI
jgi:hypothetical protein